MQTEVAHRESQDVQAGSNLDNSACCRSFCRSRRESGIRFCRLHVREASCTVAAYLDLSRPSLPCSCLCSSELSFLVLRKSSDTVTRWNVQNALLRYYPILSRIY